jgi:hypothetical protein
VTKKKHVRKKRKEEKKKKMKKQKQENQEKEGDGVQEECEKTGRKERTPARSRALVERFRGRSPPRSASSSTSPACTPKKIKIAT